MNNKLHPSYKRERWDGYLAFMWLLAKQKFSFEYSTGHARKSSWGTEGPIAARINRNGYRSIPFRFQGIRYEIMEHVAFYIHFHGFPPRGKQVNHKDLDRQNGRIENLELVSQSRNLKHAAAARKNGAVGGKR